MGLAKGALEESGKELKPKMKLKAAAAAATATVTAATTTKMAQEAVKRWVVQATKWKPRTLTLK